jgi:hypothetical protein
VPVSAFGESLEDAGMTMKQIRYVLGPRT